MASPWLPSLNSEPATPERRPLDPSQQSSSTAPPPKICTRQVRNGCVALVLIVAAALAMRTSDSLFSTFPEFQAEGSGILHDAYLESKNDTQSVDKNANESNFDAIDNDRKSDYKARTYPNPFAKTPDGPPSSYPRLGLNVFPNVDVNDEYKTCASRAETLYDDPRYGFVIGAFNHYATSNRFYGAVAAIESLVKIGGWGGKIYLLTTKREPGQPSCFSQSYLRNLTGNKDIFVIDHLQHGSSGGGYAKAKMFDVIEEFHKKLESGGERTRVPQIPEILIWHDADHLWAKAGCVKTETLAKPPDFGPNATMFWYEMHFDPKHPDKGGGNHVGTFVAHRKWSRFTLEKWAEEIERTPNTQDYNPLHHAWVSHSDQIKPLPSPEPFRDHMWNYHQNGCHNHMSYFGRCRANGVYHSQRFVASLCLNTLANYIDIVYCGIHQNHFNKTQNEDYNSNRRKNADEACRAAGNADGSIR